MLKHTPKFYIQRIIDAMKEHNYFVLENGNITTDYPIINGNFVTWNDGNGKIEINDNVINIVTISGNDYEDGKKIIAEYPYFISSRVKELNEVLRDLGKTKNKKKYPLFFLQESITEKEQDDKTILLDNISFYVITYTEKTYRSKDRAENIFDPVLIPFFKMFIETLENLGIQRTNFEKINDGYGVDKGNGKNPIDDPIDLIFSKFSITIDENNCIFN